MARLFVTDINLNKNELQNARIQGLSSAPLNPVNGQIYYNTSENKMYYYNGLAAPDGPWVSMSGSDEVIQDVLNDTIIAGYGITKTYGDPANTLTLEIDTTETADLTTAQTLENKTLNDPVLKDRISFTDNTNTETMYIEHSYTGTNRIVSTDDLALRSNDGDIILYPGNDNGGTGKAYVHWGNDATGSNPQNEITTAGNTQILTNKTIGDTLYFHDSVTTGLEGQILINPSNDNFEITANVGNLDLTGLNSVNVTANNGDIVLNADGWTYLNSVATDNAVVTAGAAQTLTNKTLTSPVVTDLHLNDSAITFEGSTADDYETTLQVTNPSADREITLPDATGTVALVENKLHDFALATQSVDLNNQKIVNLAEPVDPQDAATKYYVDSAVAGLTWKRAVHLASSSNIDLSTDLIGVVIDGHDPLSLSDVGYRILLTGQTTTSENGIYELANSGGVLVANRTTDADTVAELKGAAVFVMEGASYGATSWVQANHYLTDLSGQTWEQFAGASDYTAGAGLVADGNVFNVGQGLGISVTANEVAIDTAVTARKYSATIGNGSATSYTITHGLNNQFVVTQVYQNSSPFALVETDVELTSPTQVTVRFAVAPTADQYIVNIIG